MERQIEASRTHSRLVRLAFTVIEVLVAVSIIGLLLAVLLPAVGTVRETSRRSTCANHLHQIGVAAHNYLSSWNVFPSNYDWYRQILHQLGQPPGAKEMSIYGCPSDSYGTGDIDRCQVSYRICDGLWKQDGDGYSAGGVWKQHGTEDLTDGLSTTVAYGEQLAKPDHYGLVVPNTMYQEWWPRRTRNLAAAALDMDEFADSCRDFALPPGPGWVFDPGYNHVMTPNQNNCFNGPQSDPVSVMKWAQTASSEHPGGVQITYADGRTKFVSDAIDRYVWRAIGTRGGGEASRSP